METIQSFSRKAEYFVVSNENLRSKDTGLIEISQQAIKGNYSCANHDAVSFWDGTINTGTETIIEYPANLEATHLYLLFYQANHKIIFRSNINLLVEDHVLNGQSNTGYFLWTSNAELNLMLPAYTQANFTLITVDKQRLLEYIPPKTRSTQIRTLLKLTQSTIPFFYFTSKATVDFQQELLTFDRSKIAKKANAIVNILGKYLTLRRDQYTNQYTPLAFFTVLLIQQRLCDIPATEKPNIANLIGKESASPEYYLALFEHIFGKTIDKCHRYVHMEFAKGLLETQQLSVLEITQQLGFKTADAFTQAFKRQYRSNPRMYRPKAVRAC